MERARAEQADTGSTGPGQPGWQAEKSALMRQQILEAAIRCFVKLGYARTTTTEIAQEAGVSRGAMVHHFSNKERLITAAVAHLHHRRVASFRDAIANIDPKTDRQTEGIERYWDLLSDPTFIAFHELTFAARTDPTLEAIVGPAVREFEAEWYEQAKRSFPEWADTGRLFDLAMDLTQFLMEGMAIHSMMDDDPARYQRLRRYLVNRLKEILAAAHDPDPDAAVGRFLADDG